MRYQKTDQIKMGKTGTTALNNTANKKLAQLKIDKDVRHCEMCSNQATTNAHRHNRDWYKGKQPHLLWSYNQVIFICTKCHQRLDDRSKTTEEEKEKIFNRLRGNSSAQNN